MNKSTISAAERLQLRRRLERIWRETQTRLDRYFTLPRSFSFDEVFSLSENDKGLSCTVNFIALKFSDRYGSTGEKVIFAVIEGTFNLELDATYPNGLVIANPQTKLSYFRKRVQVSARHPHFEHCFGVHYDFDDALIGHPLYHSQFKPMMDHFDVVVRNFFREEGSDFCLPDNKMEGIPRNVRIPTAQMDVFSVLLQIVADHGTSDSSTPDERERFSRFRELCFRMRGGIGKSENIKDSVSRSCFRSPHWYNT